MEDEEERKERELKIKEQEIIKLTSKVAELVAKIKCLKKNLEEKIEERRTREGV